MFQFVLHLKVDVVGPLLLNAYTLLLVSLLTTDHGDWLVQVTKLIDIDNDGVFWVLSNYSFILHQETFNFRMLVFTVGTTNFCNFFSCVKIFNGSNFLSQLIL